VTSDLLPFPAQDPGPVGTASDRWRHLAAALGELADQVTGDRAPLAAAWSGTAADACDAELAAIAGLARGVSGCLRAAAGSLTTYAVELADARHAVALLRAEDDRLRVAAGGGPWAAAGLTHELAAVRARHAAVLDHLDQVARRTAAAVRAAVDEFAPRGVGHAVRTGRAPEAGLATALPLLSAARRGSGTGLRQLRRRGPDQVSAWWALLTSDERHRLLVARPGLVGSLAGAPAGVRGVANEVLLQGDLRLLREQRDLAGSIAPVAGRRPWALGSAMAVADALAAARAGRDPVTGRPVPASLLVYRPGAFGGQGRVAVAVGDLDRADHVAVLVPGLGSTVPGSVRGLTADAARLVDRARTDSPGVVTAVVAWTAYDAPSLLHVASEASARAGGRLLAADLRGLDAARGTPPHLTAVGHSYGSTTVGAMLRDRRTGVDDAVLLGSPGAGVDRAAELGLRPGHVWVGSASRDPVGYLDRFGTDPAHAGFGAVRFRAEDVARHPAVLDLTDHSRYYAPGGESLDNVVQVVVGDGAAVRRAAYRGELPWAPDGISLDPEADRRPRTVP
jgi:hypothetical protein